MLVHVLSTLLFDIFVIATYHFKISNKYRLTKQMTGIELRSLMPQSFWHSFIEQTWHYQLHTLMI